MSSEQFQTEIRERLDTIIERLGDLKAVEVNLEHHREAIKVLYEKHDDHEERLRAQELGAAGTKWVTGGAKIIASAVIGGLATAILGLVMASKLQPLTQQFQPPAVVTPGNH